MGGRGAGFQRSATATTIPQSSIPANYKQQSGRAANRILDDLEDEYDINTIMAINQYIRDDPQANGYTVSQHLNHKLETGQKLNANEQYISDYLDKAMHDIGQDVILTRAAHKDFLEAMGVNNYQNMTPAQLDAAVKGLTYTEKKYVSASIDASKNPFITGVPSGGREVYVHIKTPSTTKCVMGNKKQSEVILGKGITFKAIGAYFDGTTAYPRIGGALPRVIVDVEIVEGE